MILIVFRYVCKIDVCFVGLILHKREDKQPRRFGPQWPGGFNCENSADDLTRPDPKALYSLDCICWDCFPAF